MAAKTQFTCGEILDVTEVTSLQSRLQKSLQKSFTIELKAESVKKTDTAGLQLFVALAQEVRSNGGQLVWKKPSQALLEGAALLGLDKELGLS